MTANISDEKLLQYIYHAAENYKKILNKYFLLIGKNRNTEYQWFECTFQKKHFMHLLGIKSKQYTADQFFERCDNYNLGYGNGITIEDCTPSRNHNRATVNEKAMVCPDILQIHHAKYFKIGMKDKISQHVDFSYAYGSDTTLGFQMNGRNESFPITLIPKNINTFTTKSYRILFVFVKEISSEKYKDLYVEIKKGLLDELYCNFPEKLKKLIEIKTAEDEIHTNLQMSENFPCIPSPPSS